MSIRKFNISKLRKQVELETTSKDNYEILNKGLNEIINSSFYEELKETKIDITYRELQLESIDKGIENIDIEALSNMKKYTSNLGVELIEVFDKEMAKNPETAQDNIVELKETLDYNIKILIEKEPYIEDSIIFAKNFNELAISLINKDYEYNFNNLPEETKKMFDKNEELLFVTNYAEFKDDKFEYVQTLPSITDSLDKNFEAIKNDFDITIDAYRKISETGMVIKDNIFLKNKLKETVENIARYSIEKEETLEFRLEQFKNYLNEKNNYIKANIPESNLDLNNLLEELRLETEGKKLDFKELEEKNIEDIEKIQDIEAESDIDNDIEFDEFEL